MHINGIKDFEILIFLYMYVFFFFEIHNFKVWVCKLKSNRVCAWEFCTERDKWIKNKKIEKKILFSHRKYYINKYLILNKKQSFFNKYTTIKIYTNKKNYQIKIHKKTKEYEIKWQQQINVSIERKSYFCFNVQIKFLCKHKFNFYFKFKKKQNKKQKRKTLERRINYCLTIRCIIRNYN